MRLALIFSTAMFLAVGCLPTSGGNKNNSSGISANEGGDPNAPSMGDPQRPEDPNQPPGMGDPGKPEDPNDPCTQARLAIDQCFQDCGAIAQPQPGDPGTGMGDPGRDPNDPTGMGNAGGAPVPVDGDCVNMLCQPFFDRAKACLEQSQDPMLDCGAELQAQDECVRDATAQCGGGTTPVPPPDQQCFERCQQLAETLPQICQGEPPPPPKPGDVCGLLYQALDACYATPPPSCGCDGTDHGQGGGEVPPGIDPATGMPQDPNDPGRPDEPPAGGMGGGYPGDPTAHCATIEAAIVELCNGAPQCGR